MAKRKPTRRKSADAESVTVRRSSDGRGWALVHPRSARERAEDLEAVHEMIEAGEIDVALDELRWLVGGCSEFIEAHLLLGDIAYGDGDYPLARGHFGFAVQLGLKALERARASGPLPYQQPANRMFFEAGRGLVMSLVKLNMQAKATELVEQLIRLDPADPLALRALLDDANTGGLPIVELGLGGLAPPRDEPH